MSDLNKPQLIGGIDINGNLVPVKVGIDGTLGTSSGTGGSGDASAANQAIANTKLTNIDDKTTSDPATGSKQDDIINILSNDLIQNIQEFSKQTTLFSLPNDSQYFYSYMYNSAIAEIILPVGSSNNITILDKSELSTYVVKVYDLVNKNFVSHVISNTGYYLIFLNNEQLKLTTSSGWNGIGRVTLTFKKNFPLEVILPNVSDTGVDITGTTIPTGGSGIRGLLSWIAKLISDKLPSSLVSDRLKTQTVLDSTTITGTANTTNGLVTSSTDCSNYTFLSLQLTGTWSGIITFEFSNNNTDWISGVLYNLSTTGAPNTVTTGNGIYYGNKQGRYFRARLSTYSSGTVNGALSLSSSPTTPAFPVTIISGTPSVNLATVNGTSPDIATQSTLSAINNKFPSNLISDRLKTNTVGASLDLTGSVSTNGNIISSTDITDYSWITVQLTGTWISNVAIEFSNNNTTWTQGQLYNINIGATLSSVNLNGVYTAQKQGKFFRIIAFNYTSGTINASCNVSNNALATPPIQAITFNGIQPVSFSLPANSATSTLQTSILNRLMPAGSSSNLYTTLGNQINLNIQSTPGNVFAIYASNSISTVRFLQLFNITGLPANGTSPIVSFPIPPNNGLLLIGQDVLGGEGLRFSTGISFGISTTLFTYTAATSINEVFLTIRYL